MPSRDRRSSVVKEGNPFKEDVDIKKQLQALGNVNNKAEFNGWRFSFLTEFDSFLDAAGSEKAESAYQHFFATVAKLSKVIQRMEKLVNDASLTKNDATVRARQCMEEIKAECMYTSDELAELLPGSGQFDDTEKCGYTNYHMGAILIGDGFSLYGYLASCDETLMAYKDKILAHIADRQILSEIENYHRKLAIFCDVMRDLGLYGAMMKAREIDILEPEESDDEEEEEEEKPEQPRPVTPEPKPNAEPTKRLALPPAEASAPNMPKKKSSRKDQEELDLPLTGKPKAKMQLPGMAPRGTGRMSLPPSVPVPAPAPAPPPKARRETMPTLRIEPPPAKKPRPPSNVGILDHIMAEADKAGLPDKPTNKKRKKKPRYKKDDTPDLPRTAKPKAKPKFAGEDIGRGRGGIGRTLSKEEAREKPIPKIEVNKSSTRSNPSLTKKTQQGNNDKAAPLTREPQPYGMDESEKMIPLERESQPYGMEAKEPSMPLEREPQPYGMVAQEKPQRQTKPKAELEPDPPKTSKPKDKPKLPQMPDDSGRGRGAGRQLSKEEAKEKPMPKIQVKRASVAETPISRQKEEATKRKAEEMKKKKEAEEAARHEAEEQAKLEERKRIEDLASQEAEVKARKEAEKKAKEERQKVEAARREAEEKQRREEAQKAAEERRRREAEADAKRQREAEAKAKRQRETEAEAEANTRRQREAEANAKRQREAEENRKREEQRKREAEERCRQEEKRRREAEEKQVQEEQLKREAEEQRKEGEARRAAEAEKKRQAEAQKRRQEQEAEKERREQEAEKKRQEREAEKKFQEQEAEARRRELKKQQAAANAASMPKVKRVPEPPEVRSKEEKKPNVELSTEKRRKCYMWYARLGQPNRDAMIRAAKRLTENDDITPEEVEALPWICGGTLLPVKEMNELFMYG